MFRKKPTKEWDFRIKCIATKHEATNSSKLKDQVQVYMRCIFDRIIEIDTKGERFDVDVIIESTWKNDQVLKILLMPQFVKTYHKTVNLKDLNIYDINLKYLLKNIEDFNYESKFFWSPELFLENQMSAREEISYKVKVVPKHRSFFKKRHELDLSNPSAFVENLTCEVTELRKVRGVFHEKMELNDFPIDKQELSVRMLSKRPFEEVVLIEDKSKDCLVEIDWFCDEENWHLFEFCKFSNDEKEDTFTGIIHSHAKFTAFAIRRPKFYLYNAYLPLFLITTLGFTVFTIGYETPQHRLGICGILILTAVNFRWILTARLPSVSYLTFMDYFSLGGIIIHISFCVWFALVGVGLITSSTSLAKTIEMYVLIGFAVAYISFLAYVLIIFILSELYKAKFQYESEKEWKKLQKEKKAFAQGNSNGNLPKKKPDKKTTESDQPAISQTNVTTFVVAEAKSLP